MALMLVILIWMGFSSPGSSVRPSQTLPYEEAIKAFESFVTLQMSLDKVPGLSVGFIKDDFIWTRGFGYSDLENRVPAKPESSYRLASITKTITAIAVLQLVEAGKIDLDAEVQTYVPDFPQKRWPVTVRLLLGHLGGISHYRNYDVEGHIKVHKNTKEALAIFQDFGLVAQPGTKYHYSSYGFNLLGAVIEGASGLSYGQYIRKHIFEPLGMENSRMDDPVDIIPDRVRGYRLMEGEIRNSEYVDISSRFAAGGTRSTVVDLLKYAQGIMEGKLLKEKTWQKMFASMATRQGLITGYGMGWSVHPWKGHFRVSHGGSQPETRTHILIFPTENFAVAIASNLERVNLTPYIQRLAELVLEEDLDSRTYVQDREGQVIYRACSQVFSYGMSRFDWLGHNLAEGEKDLAGAFSYFNRYVNRESLQDQFEKTTKKIEEGIHPVSGRAFTKVGMFMAQTLIKTVGMEKFQTYHQTGPLAFFNDYIKISSQWEDHKRNFRFNKNFARSISKWEKEWSTVYTDYVRHLFIHINTDFDELERRLKETFTAVEIYPDFSTDMAQVARHFMEEDEPAKAFQICDLSVELYPNSPVSLVSLAEAYLWTGNAREARRLYKKAHALNPQHPSVSLNAFYSLENRLVRKGKIKELIALADIAVNLYPENANLYKGIGDMYRHLGKKETAIRYYQKALSIDPGYKEAREALQELKKEIKNYS